MHRIAQDFILQLTGKEPIEKEQMKKEVWWLDRRNTTQKDGTVEKLTFDIRT